MEVLIFQIVIFLIITYAGYKGTNTLNIISILLVIFTIAMVKTSPLMILQFITIAVGYVFCLKKNEKYENNNYSQTPYKYVCEPQKSVFELILRIIINLTLFVLLVYWSFRFFWNFFKIEDFKAFNSFDISAIELKDILIAVMAIIFTVITILALALIPIAFGAYFFLNIKQNIKELKSRF